MLNIWNTEIFYYKKILMNNANKLTKSYQHSYEQDKYLNISKLT